MEPKSRPGKQYGEGYKYVSYGLTFAGGVIVFTLGWLWVDRRLGLVPLFTVAGTLVGAVLGLLSVYRRLEAERIGQRRKKDGAG